MVTQKYSFTKRIQKVLDLSRDNLHCPLLNFFWWQISDICHLCAKNLREDVALARMAESCPLVWGATIFPPVSQKPCLKETIIVCDWCSTKTLGNYRTSCSALSRFILEFRLTAHSAFDPFKIMRCSFTLPILSWSLFDDCGQTLTHAFQPARKLRNCTVFIWTDVRRTCVAVVQKKFWMLVGFSFFRAFLASVIYVLRRACNYFFSELVRLNSVIALLAAFQWIHALWFVHELETLTIGLALLFLVFQWGEI